MKCENKTCGVEVTAIYHNPINKLWECENCRTYEPEMIEDVNGNQVVYLTDGLKSTKRRVDAMRSRYILPYKRTDGVADYYVGTRTKSGKIIEKSPDIYK